jgi:hypothetical protein
VSTQSTIAVGGLLLDPQFFYASEDHLVSLVLEIPEK